MRQTDDDFSMENELWIELAWETNRGQLIEVSWLILNGQTPDVTYRIKIWFTSSFIGQKNHSFISISYFLRSLHSRKFFHASIVRDSLPRNFETNFTYSHNRKCNTTYENIRRVNISWIVPVVSSGRKPLRSSYIVQNYPRKRISYERRDLFAAKGKMNEENSNNGLVPTKYECFVLSLDFTHNGRKFFLRFSRFFFLQCRTSVVVWLELRNKLVNIIWYLMKNFIRPYRFFKKLFVRQISLK